MIELSELTLRAQAWLADDPDPETAAETRWLLSDPEAHRADLDAGFGARLQFGTAGIRGTLGPGPGHMNRALVMRVTAGLAEYLGVHVNSSRARGVVVGHDARHGSEAFAADTCRVLSAAGFRVLRCPPHAPTPLVAFALRHLGAACGIVVTASHNPPEYNGYKVYWENGAQIIPPVDAGIAAAIDAVKALPAGDERRIEDTPPTLLSDYLAAISAQISHIPGGHEPVEAVYTAMHGVGARLCEAALANERVLVHSVRAQREPDPAFPTVRFPNPEEPGALDLADALARDTDASLILANDPDADRLSVTVRADGQLRRLTGDELGALLGDALLANAVNAGFEAPFVARSFVSGELLAHIAEHYGARCLETLTGFKWLWNASVDAEAAGGRFVFAYEEALGYSVGPAVRDKDGIGAAAVIGRLARRGDLWRRLCGIFERHGLFATRQRSLKDPSSGGLARLRSALEILRAEPPTALAGMAVSRVRDFEAGGALPPTNAVAWWLEDGSRLMLRPSGTEPKLKIYLQVALPFGPTAEREANARLETLAAAAACLVEARKQ